MLHSPALTKRFLRSNSFSEQAFQSFILNPEKKLVGLSLDYLKANILIPPKHPKYRAVLKTLQNKPGSGSNAAFVKGNISQELLVYYLKQKIFNATVPADLSKRKYQKTVKPLLLVDTAEFSSELEPEASVDIPALAQSALAELEKKVSQEDYRLFELEYLDTARVKKTLSPPEKARAYQVRLVLEALVLKEGE